MLATVLAVALVSAPIVLGDHAPAQAAIIRPFDQVFSTNTNGNIVMAANTLETCLASNSTCATAQDATTGNYSNNGYTSRFVDVDSDSTTFNSSSASLTIPADGGVLFAALVWGGRTGATGSAPADPALRGNVQFTTPSSTGPVNVAITASQLDVNSSDNAYQGYVDVTSIVSAAGSGVYTVANVQSTVGGTNNYAGWSLVVAVSDPSAPARNLTIFNGFVSIGSNDLPQTFSISGFITPPSGPVRTTLGAVTFEGDMGITGDSFKLDGTTISDGLNPANNPFNSTISNQGIQVSGRNPSYNNQLGFDSDLINADGILANGATSATLAVSTAGDQFFPAVITFATDLYDPTLLGNKTVSDLNGGNVVAGDTLRYTVPVENIGLDSATKSRFFDSIPTGTSYVPGSITVDGTPATDAADADTAIFSPTPVGHVEAYIGTGATSTSGGTIPVTSGSAQHTVTFDVTVDADTTNGQQLINAASLNYRGQTTDAAQASATNAVVSPVVATPTSSNQPPTATPEVVTFTPTSGTPGAVINVVNGDSDPENDTLTVVAVTDASGGTVVINNDGTVTYTPRPDFAGRDVFTYTIQDSAGNRSTATVRVDVVNTLPDAVDDTAVVTGGATSSIPVLSNDTDGNGDTLSVRSVSPTSTQGGTVALLSGTVRYTPASTFRGTDTFTYVVEDTRGGSDTATVTVTVPNQAPVATDDTYSTGPATAVGVSVLSNDTDGNGDVLTASVVTGPAHGTLTLNSDGTGTYTPTSGYSGTDTFTYQIDDGFGGTATAVATITINGAPNAVDDTATTASATSTDVSVLTNDTDPDGNSLTVTNVSTPTNGTATQVSPGVIRYTPTTGYVGPDSFTYTVSDGLGGTDTATVIVTVQNAPPIANPDSASTPTNTSTGQIDVLANDTDANVTAGSPGQALVISGTPTADNGATVVVNSNGTITVTPAAGFSGVVRVTYTVSDGADSFSDGTLTVSVSNTGPTAANDSATTPANTPVTVDVLANDTDPNSADTLSVVPDSLSTPLDSNGMPTGSVSVIGGQVRFTPPSGFAGTVTFTYQVTDGAVTSTGTVTITVANAAPTARPDNSTVSNSGPTTIDVLGNDSDSDSGVLSIVSVTQPTHGSVAIVNNKLVFTPESGYLGVVTFTYTVTDGQGGLVTTTVTLNVESAASVLGATGANVLGWGLLALLLVALGAASVIVAARRRRNQA